jgi:hypothetical protein
MSAPTSLPRGFVAALDALLAATERSLIAQTAGTTVCRLQQDGRVTGGMKYDEGRLVTLSAARRRLRSMGDTPACTDYRADLERELAVWRAALRAQQERPRPAVTWLAYRQGGVDALAQTLSLVEDD